MRYVTMALPLCAAVLAAPALAAEPSAPFEWTEARFTQVEQGDVSKGKKLAKRYKCMRCHNENGISEDPDVPSIAGQRAAYLWKQLHDFKGHARMDEDMARATRRMDEEEMAHVSAYYAAQERPQKVGGQPMLVVKVCDSCHEVERIEENGRIEVAPVLAGQVRPYLETSMFRFRDSERHNDLFDRMQSVAQKLTDSEIRRLSVYYSALPMPN